MLKTMYQKLSFGKSISFNNFQKNIFLAENLT